MKRAGIIAGLAALVLLAALGYYWWDQRQAGAPVTAQLAPGQADQGEATSKDATSKDATSKDATSKTGGESAPSPTPQASASDTAAPAQPAQDQTARVTPKDPQMDLEKAPSISVQPRVEPREAPAPGEGQAGGPLPILPSFDVVRVEPNGEAVLAGRATPGSRVTLLDGGDAIAGVEANPNGEWVIVLRRPLAPGNHELGLESRLATGEVLLSESVVIVAVPEPPRVAEAVTPAAPRAAATGSGQAAAPQPAPAGAGEVASAPDTVTPGGPGSETVRPLAVLMPRGGEGPSRIIQNPEPIARNLGREALVLETVDYDDQGRAVVGGRGKAGVNVIVYLDGRVAGRTVVDPDGRWQVSLEGEVPFGVHTLRIDQLNNAGQVVARVESPFSRAQILTSMADETAVIVQPGNSLWRIARRVYGEGMRYSVIYEANLGQIRDPDLIYPGQIFVVPTTN